jgi:hypothetical protein
MVQVLSVMSVLSLKGIGQNRGLLTTAARFNYL